MKRKFKNIDTGNIFFDMDGDGVFRSVHSKVTYTVEEAENSKELIEI